MKIVFLTHVFKKKIDRHYSFVEVNEKRVYEKDAFFYYLQHAKNELEKFLLVFEKIAKKTVFRVLRIFPKIHRSVEITVAIELYKCIVKIVVNLISFSNFLSKMQLHEPFLCENCFYDTYFFSRKSAAIVQF